MLGDVVELTVANKLDELGKGRNEIRVAAADRYPLRRQGIAADLPAPVHLAEHELIAHDHVVDVDGVEHLVARELT